MTGHPDCTLPTDLLDQIADSGLAALPDALRVLLNAAMLLERQKFIGADPYERSPERQAQANGFKDKTFQTRLGGAHRGRTASPGRGLLSPLRTGFARSALKRALAEMYVQGVSTRTVAAISEQVCGFEGSSAQVSRAAAELDAVLAAWRTRPLRDGSYAL